MNFILYHKYSSIDEYLTNVLVRVSVARLNDGERIETGLKASHCALISELMSSFLMNTALVPPKILVYVNIQ